MTDVPDALLDLINRGKNGAANLPRSLTRLNLSPHFYWPGRVAPLIENRRALPVLWKRPF